MFQAIGSPNVNLCPLDDTDQNILDFNANKSTDMEKTSDTMAHINRDGIKNQANSNQMMLDEMMLSPMIHNPMQNGLMSNKESMMDMGMTNDIDNDMGGHNDMNEMIVSNELNAMESGPDAMMNSNMHNAMNSSSSMEMSSPNTTTFSSALQ